MTPSTTDAQQAAEPTTSAAAATTNDDVAVETLVEDVSIDGMCGVY